MPARSFQASHSGPDPQPQRILVCLRQQMGLSDALRSLCWTGATFARAGVLRPPQGVEAARILTAKSLGPPLGWRSEPRFFPPFMSHPCPTAQRRAETGCHDKNRMCVE